MITENERQEIQDVVKKLIREKVASCLTADDIKERGIAKFDVTESYLTDIMALGYNNNSHELATNDIWELQSQMPWVNVKKIDISNRVIISATKFKTEVDSFLIMIKSISSGLDKKTIIDNVKRVISEGTN